jgi:hypothetical protein
MIKPYSSLSARLSANRVLNLVRVTCLDLCIIQDSKLKREEGSRRKVISSSLYIYTGLLKPGLGGAGYRL